MSHKCPISVSILLAARGDGVAAERTLLAIAETTGAELNYEVVVVNASKSARFDKFLSQVEGAIMVVDADSGLVKSELLGMAADVARAEYLVILDGGVTPGAGWLEALLDVASGIGERLGIAGCVLVDSSNDVVEAGYVYSDGMVVPVAGMVESSENAWLVGFQEVAEAGFFGCIMPASLRNDLGWIGQMPSFNDEWSTYCRDVAESGRVVGIACESMLVAPSHQTGHQNPRKIHDNDDSGLAMRVARSMVKAMQAAGQLTETGKQLSSSRSRGGVAAYEAHCRAYDVLARLIEKKKVIDLGCAYGYGSYVLADHCRSVIGVEASPEMLLLARALWSEANLDFEIGDAADIPSLMDELDCVVVVVRGNQISDLVVTLATLSTGLSDHQDLAIAIVDPPGEKNMSELYAGFLKGFFQSVEPIEANIEDGQVATLNSEVSQAWQITTVICRTPRTMTDGLTSIVIPAFNQVELTRNCLEAIRVHTDSNYELIVIDNGSNDGTAEYLAEQSDLRSITNLVNQGFSTAVNQGMRHARGDRILILSNDTFVPPGWLSRMTDQMDSTGAAIVGPLSNYVTKAQMVENVPYQADDKVGIIEFAQQIARDNRGSYTPTHVLSGLCLLIERDVLRLVGGFDPVFNPGNWEDIDFGLRAYASGLRSVIARDVFIHHYGGQGPGWDLLLKANWGKFKKKWGVEVEIDSDNWFVETDQVSLELLARNRVWGFCFNGTLWERPSAEVVDSS